MKKNNLSPLRYPGSKNKFYNIITNFMEDKNLKTPEFAEVFTGGASIALKLLKNKKVTKVYINDKDKNIYSFWKCILRKTEDFITKIKNISVTIQEWDKQKRILYNTDDYFERGFATFFLNRTNYSGIIKAGAIGGLEQTGKYKIDCRFNKDILIEKIRLIESMKNSIILFNLDALEFIKKIDKKNNIFIYLDPPYFNKGKDLYMNFYKKEDHIKLKKYIENIKNKWLLSYDDCEFIKNLYKNFTIKYQELPYVAGKNKKIGKEILIYNN